MSNTSKLIDITKRIQKIYQQLYTVEKNNVKNNDYLSRLLNLDKVINKEHPDLIEILRFLLEKEDELYKNLTNNEIYFLTEHMLRTQEIFNQMIDKKSDTCDEFANDNDLMFLRITIRLDLYQKMKELGDINWYQKIHRGLYLSENNVREKDSIFYYYLITSSCNIINYIKSIAYDTNFDQTTLKNKYINSFIDPFSESTLVKNDFKMDFDYDYILKITGRINKFASYLGASFVYFQSILLPFIMDVMFGKLTEIDESFMGKLTCLETFLEIIDDYTKESIYMRSVDLYRMSGNSPNECTETFFDLFNEEEFANNKEKKLEY